MKLKNLWFSKYPRTTLRRFALPLRPWPILVPLVFFQNFLATFVRNQLRLFPLLFPIFSICCFYFVVKLQLIRHPHRAIWLLPFFLLLDLRFPLFPHHFRSPDRFPPHYRSLEYFLCKNLKKIPLIFFVYYF